ncbi:MAG: PD40 domain-containing protein [Saprospiraceae bacterium]|nr:PD40 domain-containing protein [Saprospiraceae bacterium]
MLRYVIIFCFSLPSLAYTQMDEAYFIQHPCLTPDGITIIFSHDGDLWSVPAAGGSATRLTAMDGRETRPMVSPDGRWIAFSSNQYGNNDVYKMPIGGGPIVQLTFHQADDGMSSWSWDSQSIYFTSNRENRISTFSISSKGGTPQRVFSHYFNNDHHLMPHPDGERYFFNESWESNNFANRKGYKGAFNPDIKSFNTRTGVYNVHTKWEGKDFKTTIDASGNIYFLSDEFNGEYNLYQLTDSGKKQLTSFQNAAFWPNVSADGQHIVFTKDYQLWLYHVNSGRAREVPVRLPSVSTLAKEQDYQVSGNITNFFVSPDGKKLAFIARGELFVSDIKGQFIRQISIHPQERAVEVYWLKDNKTLLYSQTTRGYTNWFTQPANGQGVSTQITNDQQNNRLLTFNSDLSEAVYLSGREEVRLLDLNTMASNTLVKEELWGFYNDRPRWAPDDRHILFSAYRDFERDIMWLDSKTKQTINLTQTGVTEAAPYITPDGKYILFSSNPVTPSYPFGLQEPNLYRMALQEIDAPFRSDKFDELFAVEQNGDEKTDSTATKEKEITAIQIDGLADRISRVGPSFGSQNAPYVIQDEDTYIVLFASNHDEGRTRLWKTTIKPFQSAKTEEIKGGNTSNTDVVTAKGKHYLLIRGQIHSLNLKGGKVDKIDINHTFRRQLNNEFRQMFFETWANLEENFYSEDFHGINWPKMRDEYAGFLPYVNERDDLRRLLNDLLGELNTSHFGFRSIGKEEDIFYGTRTLSTGIEYEKQAPFTVKSIIDKTPAQRATTPIMSGDQLIAVNGTSIDLTTNRESYFAQPSLDDEVKLTFQRGDSIFTTKLHPTSFTAVRNARYDAWMQENQSFVDTQSGKRIAYVHMKNMGGGELDHFLRQMVSQERKREGIILDLRWNTGGNVHNNVLSFLSQRPYLQWKYRGGQLANQPNFSPAAKPIVLLINEQSLSDAEMTSAGFKELGLGKIIGTETYRWIIFTSGKGLVDGSFYRLPSWGCYTLDGDNIEKTGVSPDILVRESFNDRLQGNQPQLEKAIEEILKQLN